MEYSAEIASDIRKVWELIKDIRSAMLVTEEKGVLRSRPMATQKTEFAGKLWFFTDSVLGANIANCSPQVNVAFVDPHHEIYVSMTGKVDRQTDHQKMAELWDPTYKEWFPNGLEDPDLNLIEIVVDTIEFWTPAPNKVVQMIGIAKATLAGEQYSKGDYGRISLI